MAGKVKRHPITGRIITEIPQSIGGDEVILSALEAEYNVTVEESVRKEPVQGWPAIVSNSVEADPITSSLREQVIQSETKQATNLVESVAVAVAELPPEMQPDEDGWTKIQIDSQELSAFMACPRRYYYNYEMHYVPIDGVGKPVIRGGIFHEALRHYWKERIKSDNYQEATKIAVSVAKTSFEREASISRDERLEYLTNLVDFLRFIQGWNGIPLEAEKYFNIVAFEDAENKVRIYLNGRIDLISRLPQFPVLPIDFKTESERWFHSQLSNQYRIYAIACGVNLLGVQRIGSQTSLEPKDKFKLELLPFDQDVLDEFRTIQLPYWIRQMLIADETKFFPMNTTDCVHGHFVCQYADKYNGGICNVSRSVRQQKLDRYFKVGEPWDPSKI